MTSYQAPAQAALAVAIRRRRRARFGALVAAVALAAGVLPALAQGAADQTTRVALVDMSTRPQSVVLRTPERPGDVAVAVNATPAAVGQVRAASEGRIRSDNVLVIDTSATSATRLPRLQAAAHEFVDGLAPGERVAIIGAGGVPRLVAPLITDTAHLHQSIDNLIASGDAAVFDSVTTGVELLVEQGARIRSVTVLVASRDAGTGRAAVLARADALDNGVIVNVVSLTSDDFSSGQAGPYHQIANETGGVYQTTNDPEAYNASTARVAADVRSLYTVAFETDQAAAGGNITVDVGSGPVTAGFVPNTITAGTALRNTVRISDGSVGFLTGGTGVALAIVLGAGAAGLGGFALISVFVRGDDRLQSVLQPYTETAGDGGDDNALAKNVLFQRAVELTSNIAEKQGLLAKAERALEQANLPLRAAEAVTFYAGTVIASIVLSFLVTRGSLLIALVCGLLGALLPPAVLNFLASRRRKKFMLQLPDTLSLLAGTLKAGYSFMQGVEAVSREVEEPMGAELRRVVTEAQLGRPLEEALDASAERMNSPDFAWAVMAVRIQREVGGNLAELLITVADTMTARQRLRGEVSALTAEGRISAIVLGILPVGLGAILFVINREYMNVLLTDTLGKILLGVACASALMGFAWMKKIINIDI